MKQILIAGTLALFATSMAFAGEQKFTLKGNFAVTDSAGTIDCDSIAKVLPLISSTELAISVTKACEMNEHPSEFVDVILRVLGDIATYGANEIACRQPGGGIGCGMPAEHPYKELTVSVSIADSAANFGMALGTPVQMTPDDCNTASGVIMKLHSSTRNIAMDSYCDDDGILYTQVIDLK